MGRRRSVEGMAAGAAGELLTLQNADEWRHRVDGALSSCEGGLKTAMLEKAALLHSDALA